MENATVKLIKGTDDYLRITPLVSFCNERGYKIIEETVVIAMPKGKELMRFNDDVRKGKVNIFG